MGDVGEGAAVHKSRGPLQGLHKVGLERVAQEDGHRAVRLQIGGGDRLLVPGVGHDDAAQTLAKFGDRLGETKNRHDFGSHGDVESAFAADAVGRAAEADDDVPQGAVVHVHDPPPHDARRIDAEGVAMGQMVVEHRRQEIVGRGNRVKVAGEVEVDILHWHDLGIAATGGAAFDAKARTQGGFTQADRGALADAVQRIAQADRGRGFAFPGGRRRDGGDQDQLAELGALHPPVEIQRNLGFVFAVEIKLLHGDFEARGDFFDRLCLGLAGDFDVGRNHFGGHVMGRTTSWSKIPARA